MIRSLSPLDCTSPPNIRIANRQEINRKRERDPALIKIKKAWCKGKKCSCGCGRDANTAHHPRGELYESDPVYYDSSQWEPYYSGCHQNLHRGYVKCPSCGGWMKPGKEMCWKCRGKPSGKHRLRYPCKFRLQLQRCSKRIICPYGYKSAEQQCEIFEKREWK